MQTMDVLTEKAMSLTSAAINRFHPNSAAAASGERDQSEQQKPTTSPQIPQQPVDTYSRSPSKAVSAPFGGDTNIFSAPIGFNINPDLLLQPTTRPEAGGGVSGPINPTLALPVDKRKLDSVSSESLYQGTVWQLTWFLRGFMLAFLRLLLFIRKVYEDYHTVINFGVLGLTGYLTVSLAVLLLPTTVFTAYRISRYLQVVLPQLRLTSISGESNSTQQALQSAKNHPKQPTNATQESENESLMQSNLNSEPSSQSNNKPALLPTELQQELEHKPRTSIPSQIIPSKVSLEQSEFAPIDIGKLGSEQNKSTGVALGVFEQLVHGCLYVFWQLKRQVDLVSYLVERICTWRKPLHNEKEEINVLSRHSDGLEFFQDFYAAFLAIIIQLCRQFKDSKQSGSDIFPKLEKESVSNILGAASRDSASSDKSLFHGHVASAPLLSLLSESSQIVVSTLVIWSLLVAVRRRDDGPLSLFLCTIGWGCIFFSRLFLLSLSYSQFGLIYTLIFVLLHVLGITIWIYKIAIDSHDNRKDERQEQFWDVELAETGTGTANTTVTNDETVKSQIEAPSVNVTDSWSMAEHASLICQIFFLFAIPSLFYWPFMFNLKLNRRPYKYMTLILTENFTLIMGLILLEAGTATLSVKLLVPIAVCSIVGFLFLCLYLLCKPSLTEYFAHADSLFNESKQSGIYYEFCSRVFKMPELGDHKFKRLMNQEAREEEIESLQTTNQ